MSQVKMVMKTGLWQEPEENVGGYLKNDGEVDHDEGGGDHQVLLLYLGLIQHGGQTISNSPSQATVAHDDLVHKLQRNQPEFVQDPGEEEDTCGVPKPQ